MEVQCLGFDFDHRFVLEPPEVHVLFLFTVLFRLAVLSRGIFTVLFDVMHVALFSFSFS